MTTQTIHAASAYAAAAHALNLWCDVLLLPECDESDRLIRQIDDEWDGIAADDNALAWYRDSIERLRAAIDPTRSSAAPGSGRKNRKE